MTDQKTGLKKNLPKRCGNTKLQTRRATSWAAGQARKLARQKVQDAAHERNLKTVAAGGLTPWETAKAEARERRAAAASRKATEMIPWETVKAKARREARP